GQPARAPRRLVRHAPLAHPPELPELLARRHPLPDDRNPTREGALSAYNARSDEELASTLPVVAPGRRAGRGGSRAFRARVPDGDLRLLVPRHRAARRLDGASDRAPGGAGGRGD